MEDGDEGQEPRAPRCAERARALRESKYVSIFSLFIRLQWLWKNIHPECQKHGRVSLFTPSSRLFRASGSNDSSAKSLKNTYEESLTTRA